MTFRFLRVLLLVALPFLGRTAVLVPNFSETAIILPGIGQTTDIEWAPDTSKRLFLTQKDGTVRVMQNGALRPEVFAALSAYTSSECGLIGLCFDPNFLVNHYIYFFITVSASEQQIVRCEEVPGGAPRFDVLLRGLPTQGNNHDGGGIAVGLDGKLYFSIGDLGSGVGVNSDLSSLAAKVGRCNLDGSEVVFNPFHDGAGPNNDYIYARGFRNPFKLSIQPTTGLVWVDATGEVYEQIFAVDKGDHAGWNLYDNNQPNGFIRPRVKYRTNGTDTWPIAAGGVYWHSNIITFTTTAAHGFRPGERVSVSGVSLAPDANGTYYVDTTPTATTFTVFKEGPHIEGTGGQVSTFNVGGAVTGGCFYNSGGFSGEYRQNYFFCDFNSGRIQRVTFDGSNEVATVENFVNGVNGAVDVTTGPDGDLYYTGFGNEPVYRLSHTNNPLRICATPQFLNMAEGGVAVVHVRLTSPPASTVRLDVARTSGSVGISTTNVALTFTPANYSNTQPIFIQAAPDADRAVSQAAFTLSCPGYQARQININAYDPDHGTLAFSSVGRPNNLTRLQLATERKTRVALDASTNLVTWQALSTNNSVTNIITIFDNSPVLPRRFYRGRVSK
ncbi:MAG TPA: PQQ-dependent sugar dehydrogenase [Verrucomicrobiae bacterium]|nr:PQQ-dependent sugar dehydrogenase [Verrucomicrobiae bacterium]